MINQGLTNIPMSCLSMMNYYPIRYDSLNNYLSYSHISSEPINHFQLKKGLLVNYLMYFNPIARNLPQNITMNAGNTTETNEKKKEEFNQNNLNFIENQNCCKLEAENPSNAPKKRFAPKKAKASKRHSEADQNISQKELLASGRRYVSIRPDESLWAEMDQDFHFPSR